VVRSGPAPASLISPPSHQILAPRGRVPPPRATAAVAAHKLICARPGVYLYSLWRSSLAAEAPSSERDGQRAPARAKLTSSFASTSAPFASSASTTSKWPFPEAQWSGVPPLCGEGEHRDQRLPSHQTHTLELTHECMHSLMPTPRTRARTHTYTRTDTPTHEKTHTCTHMHTHALRYTLHTYIHRYANLGLHRHTHPTPLTAPELAHVTTHSGSPRTYNAAACGNTRISWRDTRRHTPSLSQPSPARGPVILAHSSPVNPLRVRPRVGLGNNGEGERGHPAPR
jgi:hypothetical protein